MKIIKRYFKVTIFLIFLSGCSSSIRFTSEDFEYPKGYEYKNDTEVEETYQGATFRGKASFYADKFHGRHTASGEIFDMNKLTAAHRTIPFGSTVRVKNLWNNKYVDVKINDRGPFVEGRIIDLSKAAAEQLAMTAAGVVDVEITVIETW